MEHFDVAVVGGRVAGSAIATHLALAGLSVVLLERVTMPSDTPSTHTVQEMSGLARLGVLGALHESGAPVMMRTTLWIDDLDLSVDHPALPRICVRRVALDAIFANAARRAGADVRQGSKVIELRSMGGRVSGLAYRAPDGALRAVTSPLVIGADGRSSTVARLVGARRYDVTWNERGAVWRYFVGVPAPPEFFFCRRGAALLLAAPCDAGRTLLAVQPSLPETPSFRAADMIEQSFAQHAVPWGNGGVSWEEMLAAAVPDGEPRMVLRYQCFFRESAGPGWALLGDAGHVKDVVTGQGISDALRQAERMADHIVAGWGSDRSLDAALRRWWRSRDRIARPMYWLSQDIGREGLMSPVFQGFFRRIADSERLRLQLQQTLSQQQPVRKLTSVRRFLAVAGDLMQNPAARRAEARRDVWATARLDVRRRARGLHRQYEQDFAPQTGWHLPAQPDARLASTPGAPGGPEQTAPDGWRHRRLAAKPDVPSTGTPRKGHVMAAAQATEFIRCTVNEAFALISTPEKHPLWQTDLESDGIIAGDGRVGSRGRETRRVMGRLVTMEYQVTEYLEPQRWAFQSIGGPITMAGSLSCEAVGDGTQVRMELSFSGWYGEAMARFATRQFRGHLRKLKDIIEDEKVPAPDDGAGRDA